MTNILPQLSGEPWLTAAEKQIEVILGHFFATEDTVSNEFNDTFIPWATINGKYGHDPYNMAKSVEDSLSIIYSRYFPSNVVEVTIGEADDDNKFELFIYVSVSRDGKTHVLKTGIDIVDGIYTGMQ